MEPQKCIGLTNAKSVSSPMPAVGLYIAASTSLCLLLLFCDVKRGIRLKKPILPCKYFSLNSFTITLLGIATKLPVDLTSSMPRGIDQLSKLCGPVFITICMAFFTPSLADMEGFQLLSNMASLTILVVTVLVNLSVQMSTGIIFSLYFVEHVIALSLMLLTLFVMWYVTFIKDWITGSFNDMRSSGLEEFGKNKDLHTNEEYLKTFCVNSYVCSPQVALCTLTNYAPYVTVLCILSLSIVVEACLRTYSLKHVGFCTGESDYKWSTWVVVVVQIFTVAVGTFAIACRSACITWLSYYSIFSEGIDHQRNYDFSHGSNRQSFLDLIQLGPFAQDFATMKRFTALARTVCTQGNHYLPLKMSKMGVKIVHVLEEFTTYFFFVLYRKMAWTDYTIKASIWCLTKPISSASSTENVKSVFQSFDENVRKHVGIFIETCRKDQPHLLIEFLSHTRPSQESSFSNGCLLAVILIRIASIMLPSDYCQPLDDVLNEAFEMMYFIDQKSASSSSFRNDAKKKTAKKLWMSKGSTDHWFQKKIINVLQEKYQQVRDISSHDDIDMRDEFLKMLSENTVLETGSGSHRLLEVLSDITPETTAHEIRERIKQLLVDILYFLLPQITDISFNYICQSPDAEFDQRARTSFKYLFIYSWLKPHLSGSVQRTDKRTSPKTRTIEAVDATKSETNASSSSEAIEVQVQ